jgi:hypothetical protein
VNVFFVQELKDEKDCFCKEIQNCCAKEAIYISKPEKNIVEQSLTNSYFSVVLQKETLLLDSIKFRHENNQNMIWSIKE